MNRATRRLFQFMRPGNPASPAARSDTTLTKILLACGIVSSLWYVTMDIVASRRYEGYSYTNQTISELSAVDSPMRPLTILVVAITELLLIALGVGVGRSAGRSRALRLLSGLLVGYAIVNLAGLFTPMHQREVLAAGGGTVTDTLHIALGAANGLFFLTIVPIGAAAHGKLFRLYSVGTILVIVVFGTLNGMAGAKIADNEPTPWVGAYERIAAYAFFLWVAAQVGALLRAHTVPIPRKDSQLSAFPTRLPS